MLEARSKERVTVLVCANMDGTEKYPLLTIGKFLKPRCFRGITCLPTEYDANHNAWMTSVLFERWLRKWDSNLTLSGRKIALVIDNCSAHPHVSDLESIELVFLPPNTTSAIQPCDQGVIKTLKTYYRKSMVKSLIAAISEGLTIAEFKISLLDALQMIRKAWDSITSSTIANCFRKAGFIVPAAPSDEQRLSEPCDEVEDSFESQDSDNGSTLMEDLDMDDPCSFEEYVDSDCALQCAPMLSNEDIISTIRVDDSTTDDAGDSPPQISYQEAHSCFLNVKSFLLQMCTDNDNLHCILGQIEQKILSCDNVTK